MSGVGCGVGGVLYLGPQEKMMFEQILAEGRECAMQGLGRTGGVAVGTQAGGKGAVGPP